MGEATEPGGYFVSNYPPFERWTAAAVADVEAAFDAPPTDAALGLYLHIPFCRKRCKFCYFRVYTDVAAADVERYSRGLAAEARLVSDRTAIRGRPLRYVYFGGGTPSFLSVRQLEKLVDGIRDSFGWEAAEEVTFECEPGTLAEPKVRALRDLGMTRISLGVEHLDDDVLEANGRAHRSAEIHKAWDWIRSAGFPCTNVDLIAGMVGDSFESWRRCVDGVVAMGADSVTIYQMELPANTTLVHDWKATGVPAAVADWPTKRAWVDHAFDRFLSAGYSVSSGYTLVRDPSVAFRYRDMLWEGSDLMALGVASFGHLSGVHYQNASKWDEYLGPVESGRMPLARGLRATSRELLIREMVLCLKRGWLDVGRLRERFGVDPLEEWREIWNGLAEEGFLEATSPRPVLTRQGLLQVDRLIRRFFDPSPDAASRVA
jgi:oxygen-independent coproporphyrinogen-3 oxidase